MFEAVEPAVTWIAVVVGLAALVVVVRAPGWERVHRWASGCGQEVSDLEVTAVRSLLTRAGLVSLVVFVVLAPLMVALGLKAAGPALALALAVTTGAGVSVEGGRTRRASLAADAPSSSVPGRVLLLAGWSVGVGAAAAGLWWWADGRSGAAGFRGLGPGTSMPDLERWVLPALAVAALVHAAVVVVVTRRVLLRRATPGVGQRLDTALRAAQRRRAVAGALAGNVVLTAAVLTSAPLLTLPEVPGTALVRWVALGGTVVVGLALLVLAAGLRLPRHRPDRVGAEV